MIVKLSAVALFSLIMSLHRKRKQRDHRRGKSVEEIAQKELIIIMDESEINSMDPLLSDTEMEIDEDNNSPHLYLKQSSLDSLPSSESVDAILDEIHSEISDQYTPKAATITNRSKRSDSHYNASTPLIIKKYNNEEVNSLITNRKPELVNADKLELLTAIKNEQDRENALIQKLSLCEVVNLDFRSEDESELQAIENKKNVLKECCKYLTSLKGQWSSIRILDQIFRTVQINLFRSLPDSYMIEEFVGIDEAPKYTLPCWTHLQFVYELLFQVIMNKNIKKQILEKYLCGSFLSNFVQIFHSLCKAEVDYVKILVHSIYLDFVSLRDEVRIALSQYCWDFVYCSNGTCDGINAILDIINSILQGIEDDKLQNDNGWQMVLLHVLCPLHKGREYAKYQNSLHKCIKTYIKSQPEYIIIVLNFGLFRFWPQTNPSKEVLFVKEILNLLKIIKRAKLLCQDQFSSIFKQFIKQIGLNLLSCHYQIVQETIDSFKEKLLRQCIDFHGGEQGWNQIYKSLIYATKNHYLNLTKNAAKQMMDWLKKYRITKKYISSFEKLEKMYDESAMNKEKNECTKRQNERQKQWKIISNLAKENEIKMKNEIEKKKKQKKGIKTKTNESDLAHLFYENDDSLFKYPPKKLKSFHRAINSQPMPDFDSLEPINYKKRASALENDYGYPRVHSVYKLYREQKRISCSKQEKLVLFGKKNGFHISYSETSKYFKMRLKAKNVNEYRRSKKKKKQKKKNRIGIQSPIIQSVKEEQQIEKEIANDLIK